MRRRRPNPLPPPVDVGNRQQKVDSVIERALLDPRYYAGPRRVAWALVRSVEEVLREADRRGLMANDRPERVLDAVRAWCLEAGTIAEVREETDALRKEDPENDLLRDVPHGRTGSFVRLAVTRLGRAVSDFQRTESQANWLKWTAHATAYAWQQLGEPQSAAETRVLRTVREGLREP